MTKIPTPKKKDGPTTIEVTRTDLWLLVQSVHRAASLETGQTSDELIDNFIKKIVK